MMFTRRTGVQLVTAFAATIGLASTGAVGANAAEAPDPLSAVTQATPQTIASAAAVPTTDTGVAAIDATVNSTRITVPVDPEPGIQLGTTKGQVSVGLPFAASAGDASVEKRGVVSYDNRNSSTTLPVVQSDARCRSTP